MTRTKKKQSKSTNKETPEERKTRMDELTRSVEDNLNSFFAANPELRKRTFGG